MFRSSEGLLSLVFFLLATSISQAQDIVKKMPVVVSGRSPSIAVDGKEVYLSFSSGDSLFYAFSNDKGQSFSAPALVAVLKGLVSVGGRGPQIVAGKGQLLIAAPDTSGDFHTWLKKKSTNNWIVGARINDIPKIAKEGFLSLGAKSDGGFFAVWLDLRNGKKNNLYGARSIDGGKSWLRNQLVYRSPDGSVCDCCKPSLAIQGGHIVIMFRNNLNGNRDLYLTQSTDGGLTFDKAKKLGEGNWKLNGCPMDGGGLMIENTMIRTVWQRDGDIYTCKPGAKETLLNKGRQCAIAGTGSNYHIIFISKGILYSRGTSSKIAELGPASGYPKIVSLGKSSALCIWENEKKIYRTLL